MILKKVNSIFCIVGVGFALISCNDTQTVNGANTQTPSTPQVTVQNNAGPTNDFKDIIKILSKDGIKYQIVKPNKEIRISVSKTVNSKFSDWTPAKVYSYLSGEDFHTVSDAINNNPDNDYHYDTKNIKFNASNLTMVGGSYDITNKL